MHGCISCCTSQQLTVKKIILLISIFSCFVILSFTNLTAYESLSVSLFIYAIFSFVYDIGKKLAVLDVIILLAIFTCLVLSSYRVSLLYCI